MLHISELTDMLLTDLYINTTTNPEAVIQQWTFKIAVELLFRSCIFIDAVLALGHNSYFSWFALWSLSFLLCCCIWNCRHRYRCNCVTVILFWRTEVGCHRVAWLFDADIAFWLYWKALLTDWWTINQHRKDLDRWSVLLSPVHSYFNLNPSHLYLLQNLRKYQI